MTEQESRLLMEAVEQLRTQVAGLQDRVAALERELEARGAGAEPISEGTLIAISAAVAAYLGKRPKIRQIRLVGSAGWAQQGRVSIQASHRLELFQ